MVFLDILIPPFLIYTVVSDFRSLELMLEVRDRNECYTLSRSQRQEIKKGMGVVTALTALLIENNLQICNNVLQFM